jgi:hypothetical protein
LPQVPLVSFSIGDVTKKGQQCPEWHCVELEKKKKKKKRFRETWEKKEVRDTIEKSRR